MSNVEYGGGGADILIYCWYLKDKMIFEEVFWRNSVYVDDIIVGSAHASFNQVNRESFMSNK